MNKNKLIEIVTHLVKSPKGILAIDESLPTCNKRFEKLGVPMTEEKRQEYRELLITAPEIEKYISGFILFDETIKQTDKQRKRFTFILQSKGIDVGIKVDKGTVDFVGHPGDKVTEGLAGLNERLKEYKNMGATFAKWRAVYKIGENTPSKRCMEANAEVLASYALVCQMNDVVPIVEPEIMIDGGHTIEKCYEVTASNLDIVFSELEKQSVFIPGIILKTSMVLSGKDALDRASAPKVAEMTVKCLREHVPADIGGIVFLSGGQEDLEATENLNAMHKIPNLPWNLTFSFGRAIQNPALKAWAKNPEDITGAQALLLERAKANSLASVGEYK